MDTSILLFGGIVGFTILACSYCVRFGKISAKIAFIIITILPFIVNAIIVLCSDGDILKIFCVGILLSLAFGPASYVLAQYLEKLSKK